MALFGPLYKLKWRCALCPCLDRGEDAHARRALKMLNNLKVTWHKAPPTSSSSSVGGMLSNWLSGSSSSPSSNSNSGSDAVEAHLKWVDGTKGPELQVHPIAADAVSDGEISMTKSAGYIKTVYWKQVIKVVAKNTLIVLQGNSASKTKLNDDLVILEVPESQVKDVHDAFQEMISWEGRRQADITEEDGEMEEEGGLHGRAQKAAHFARREIEMKQHRRDREKRKAKYIKEAGGLKYTALAMANREADLS